MNNKYTWKQSLAKAEEILEEGQLLEDNAGTQWDVFNLAEHEDEAIIDDDHYYCVGYDGRIGYTEDNGCNVNWLFKVVE